MNTPPQPWEEAVAVTIRTPNYKSSQSSGDFEPSPVLQAALTYIERGWNPTPLYVGTKAAQIPDWTTTRITAADAERLFSSDVGIGLVLGELSNGLVCVDLDDPLAIRLAGHFLPPTQMIEGRKSKPRSHWFYVADPLDPLMALPARWSLKAPKSGLNSTIAELLSHNAQAAVPPSINGKPDAAETREWAIFEEPSRVDGAELIESVRRLTVACALASVWPKGKKTDIRHEASMHLAGGLLIAGWSERDVERTLHALAVESGDGEPSDRQYAIKSTVERIAQDKPVTGWNKLAKLLDAEAVWEIRDLAGAASEHDDGRPAVRLRNGDMNKVTDEAWEALEEANEPPMLFRQSNRAVRVEQIDDSSRFELKELTSERLRNEAMKRVRWFRVKTEPKTRLALEVPDNPSIELMVNMLANAENPLPFIERVVTAPIFAPDGTLNTEPGYHEAARAFYSPADGLVVPQIPEQPTTQDVAAARALVEEMLHDFPFATDADRAHAYALMILPFVRSMINGPTPLHMIEAPTPGTGKGKLLDALAIPFVGGRPSGMPPTTSDEEWRKRIMAALRLGRSHLFVDNISEKLESGSLAEALTGDHFEDRNLGKTEIISAPIRCVWVMTANNPVHSEEIGRRMLRIRINRNSENPGALTEKDFLHADLLGWVFEHRAELIGAVLTLIQAWVATGQPHYTERRKGSFESWSEVIGGILEAVGIEGFLDPYADYVAEVSTEKEIEISFVDAWWALFGPHAKPASDLVALASQAGLEFDNFGAQGAANLGYILHRMRDNVYAGIAVRKTEKPIARGKGKGYFLEAQDKREWTPPFAKPTTDGTVIPITNPFGKHPKTIKGVLGD